MSKAKDWQRWAAEGRAGIAGENGGDDGAYFRGLGARQRDENLACRNKLVAAAMAAGDRRYRAWLKEQRAKNSKEL